MVPEDDVDLETLQAQIDMTMSFAHDLVTSWIKPTHLSQLRSSSANTMQILEEELRRPPRLGVGAPIPTAPLAHEASKLKHRLRKHETKSEGVVESQPQDSSKSDDEDHKGRPSKRKMKADPFGHEGNKKKRKAEPKINSYSSAENAKRSALGELAKHNSSSGKEKQQTEPDDQRWHATEGQRSVTLISSPLERLPVQTTFPPSLTAPSLSEPSREISVPVPGQPTTPEWSRTQTNFMSMLDKARPLGIPLLNLEGPPEFFTNKAGNTSELTNPKKKRKRRKRKKNKMMTGSGDN